ncbi:uncharacterized protein LOC112152231 [Oryzias melastigma]|uniref:uncharacterized protein LOC112152231 n=1 Tax=Oryzias melastigma TaxID=30732 RepID=UPI000CF809B3|nr:uncharacterized protein LOC112152231 [Oryzias melastigma]
MGNANEKQSGGSASSLVTFMKAKHGVECCEFVDYWCQKHGFPEGGSLSKCQLEKLRKNLTEERRMLYERKRVKTKAIKRMDDMNECLKVWEAECEKRERQKACRSLTALKIENKKEITVKKADESTENKETSSAPSSFLYPSTQNLWTADDIIAASKHLPKPEKGGEVLARALEDFVRDYVPSSGEMARVMLHILSQSQFSTLRSHFEAQHQPVTHDWHDPANQNAENVTYRQWKDGLIAAVRAHFPVQCDHVKVSVCKQREDEDVEELLDRLQAVYDIHSGMTKPDDFPRGDMTPYETLLRQHSLMMFLF